MMYFILCALLLVTVSVLIWLVIRLSPLRSVLALLMLFLIVPAVHAAPIGTLANPIIDQVQGQVIGWIVGGVMAAFWGAATWLGSVIGWRFIERMNRATMQESAERYANSILDLIQARYLGSASPDLSDLIDRGVGYIKTGNAGTVKQSRITDDRLGAYVSAAIQQVRADTLVGLVGTHPDDF